MPFTFSHPAAVLPLSYIPKKYISITGLVIGSITPDFEYFFRLEHHKTISHTWSGMFWFDLPLSLVLFFIFNLVVRNALINNVPSFLNRRFSRYNSDSGKDNIQKNFLIIILCLLIGITSHLIWDRLTHKTVELVEEHWVDFYSIFWDANSMVGAAIIAFSIWQLPKGLKTKKNNLFPFWIILFVVAFIMVYLYLPYSAGFRDLGIPFISGCLLGLIVASFCDKAFSSLKIKYAQSGKG